MVARRLTLGTLVWLCALIGASVLLSAPASAARGHVFEKTFGEPCSSEPCGNGQFTEPSGVAVNEATGDVYVIDKGDARVEYFSSSGVYAGQFDGSATPAGSFAFFRSASQESGDKEVGIAIDNACHLHKLTEATTPTCGEFDPSNGDVYVVDDRAAEGHEVVDKFSATGVYIGQLPAEGAVGVSVGAAGNVWIDKSGDVAGQITEYTNAESNVFEPPTRQSRAPLFVQTGFAVDSEDNFYELNGFSEYLVYKLNNSGEVLLNPVDEEPASTVAVELSTNDSYVDNLTSVGRFSPSGELLERLGAGHLTRGGGIGVNSTAEEVYVADAAAGKIDLFTPAPPGPPTVQGAVSEVRSSSAILEAKIDPDGESTEYHFEYGPCATLSTCATSGYGKSTPNASAGSEFATYSVNVEVRELLPGTVYHFRVVAHNASGTVDGERTFTTETAEVFALPDGREWEMVSPPDKQGALVRGISELSGPQASFAGNAIAYVTTAPTESDPQGYSFEARTLSLRGPAGWQSRVISPAHAAATGVPVGNGDEYRLFSEDLSLGLVHPFGPFTPSLSAEASEQTTFLRTDYQGGDVNDPCVSSCYRPLVTGTPGFANVPPGTHFGEEGECPVNKFRCGPELEGATPDLSHVVLSSSVALTEGGAGGLYEWSAGNLAPVSLLPESEGGGPAGGAELGGQKEFRSEIRHAVSDDGSRVFFSVNDHLYMRDLTKRETVMLDTVVSGEGEGGADALFQTASSDGSRVFFMDAQRLTEDSGTNTGGSEGDLYECQIVEVAGKPECNLSDLTPLSSGESAAVQGTLVGASEDGTWVYFAAAGALPGTGAAKGTCKQSSTCNLYVRHGGTTKLVAVLSGKDLPDWQSALDGKTARVSPDGRWFAFMSQQELTGYDNHDAVSGMPDEEVYLYDGKTETLACASCNPTGARPVGEETASLGAFSEVLGPGSEWSSSSSLAAMLPTWTPYKLLATRYQSRYLSDSGRLFFNGDGALVPQDVDGTWDVYEYEPPGVPGGEHACTASSATFSARSGGCVDLISSGSATQESVFMDASETGGDVFFLTTAKLSPQDYDHSLDVYDAHECTASSACISAPAVQPPECTTADACRAAPTPQPSIFGAPASATFNGEGNITSSSITAMRTRAKRLKCKKGLTKKHNKCVKKKPKKANANRRAK